MFQIEGIVEEDGTDLPCPECGVSIMFAPLVRAEEPDHPIHTCKSCQGYGGPADELMPVPQFRLETSNVNGAALLSWLGIEAEPCGEADPRDILAALATRNPADLVCDYVEFHPSAWATGRRTAMMVNRYIEVLTKIAKKSIQYGRRVIWH